MGKKRKKDSSSTSSPSDSDSDGAPKKKQLKKTSLAPVAGPRFNVAGSDSEDERPNAAGISSASAADSFNKRQWELMERLKVDYRKQSDKKAKKEEKQRKKEEKKQRIKESGVDEMGSESVDVVFSDCVVVDVV